jgi:hypothetical protein
MELGLGRRVNSRYLALEVEKEDCGSHLQVE